MKRFLIFLSLMITISAIPVFAVEYGKTQKGFKYPKHAHYESSYQHAWCKAHNGIEEYENNDFTRVIV